MHLASGCRIAPASTCFREPVDRDGLADFFNSNTEVSRFSCANITQAPELWLLTSMYWARLRISLKPRQGFCFYMTANSSSRATKANLSSTSFAIAGRASYVKSTRLAVSKRQISARVIEKRRAPTQIEPKSHEMRWMALFLENPYIVVVVGVFARRRLCEIAHFGALKRNPACGFRLSVGGSPGF